MINTGRSGRLRDLLFAGVGAAVADVLGDGATEQPGVLQHHADPRPQRLATDRCDVHSVDEDGAGIHVVEPHQQIDQGGLAGTGGPDDRHRAARLDDQRDVADHRCAGTVGEVHVPELDAPRSGRQFFCRRGGFLRFVEKVEDPLSACHAGLQGVVHTGQLGQRLIELTYILDERLHTAQRHLPGGHLVSADHRHRHISDVADDHGGRRHQPGEELGAETGVVDLAVEPAECGLRRVAVSEGLDHRETAVGLFDMCVEPAGVGPLGHEQFSRPARDGPDQQQ